MYACYTLGMPFQPRLCGCISQAIPHNGRRPSTCLTAKSLLNPTSRFPHLNSIDEVPLGLQVDSFRHVALGWGRIFAIMQSISEEKGQVSSERYLALLEVASAIVSHRTLEELFTDLAHRLHPIIDFTYLSVLLYDSTRNVMRVHILNSDGPDTVRPGMEFSMDESPSAWVWSKQQSLVLDDLDREDRFARPSG